jgi:hypothetical protein
VHGCDVGEVGDGLGGAQLAQTRATLDRSDVRDDGGPGHRGELHRVAAHPTGCSGHE